MVSLVGAQKFPIDETLLGISRAAIDQYHMMMGKAMPASVVSVEKNNTIVKVKIEIQGPYTYPEITCAVTGPEYIRFPIQKGDKGLLLPSDYYLGAMNGFGAGVATLTRQPNLSAMVFTPIGNKKFEDVKEEDKNKVVLYGPDGVVLQTPKGDKGKVDVTEKGVKTTAAEDSGGRIDVLEDGTYVYGEATGDKQGTYIKCTATGFEFYVGDSLKAIIDGAGLRMIGGPRPGGGNYGVTITDHGTQIDNFNWLNHVHQGVTPGPGNSAKINETVSPP